jgi:hypothetical protein
MPSNDDADWQAIQARQARPVCEPDLCSCPELLDVGRGPGNSGDCEGRLEGDVSGDNHSRLGNIIEVPGEPGSKKLMLTILGGASFSNLFSYIVETILSCEDLIVASGLDVYLVCFQDREFNAMWDGSNGFEYRRANDQQFEGLKGLVKRTNGTVINTIK